MMKWFCGAGLLVLVCVLTTTSASGNEVQFTAADGQPLVALLHRPAAKTDLDVGVILLPMYNHTKETWQPLVQELSAAGFTCLSLDLRGNGGSRYGADGDDLHERVLQRDPVLFNNMYHDVEAAAAWLRQNVTGLRHLALIGASVGCSVAIQSVTDGHVKADAMVLMTPGKNYLGIPTMAELEQWPGMPLLILSSEEEKQRGAAAIFSRLKDKGAQLELLLENNIHGTNMFGRVPGVEALIVSWLKQQVAPSAGQQPAGAASFR